MIVEHTKITRPDPGSESGSYVDCILNKDTIFCCDRFKEYTKKFAAWKYDSGRFTIVDEITYEGSSQIPIDFCPFCGQEIEYKEIKTKLKQKKK